MTTETALIEALRRRWDELLGTILMTGQLHPACCTYARDPTTVKILTADELRAAILGALTGKNWRVSQHAPQGLYHLRDADLYVCDSATADEAIAKLGPANVTAPPAAR